MMLALWLANPSRGFGPSRFRRPRLLRSFELMRRASLRDLQCAMNGDRRHSRATENCARSADFRKADYCGLTREAAAGAGSEPIILMARKMSRTPSPLTAPRNAG